MTDKKSQAMGDGGGDAIVVVVATASVTPSSISSSGGGGGGSPCHHHQHHQHEVLQRKFNASSSSPSSSSSSSSSSIARRSSPTERANDDDTDDDPTSNSNSNSNSNPNPCILAGKCISMCTAYGHVCPYIAKLVQERVSKERKRLCHDSKLLFIGDGGDSVRHFDREQDIILGDILGEGGFCQVFRAKWKQNDDNDKDQVPLALKTLKKRIVVDPETFRHGAVDLAVNEVMFLQALNGHPNIITLHGVTNPSITPIQNFAILIDRLDNGTLDDRIHITWKSKQQSLHDSTSFVQRHFHGYRDKLVSAFCERMITAAIPICTVMSYLHDRSIIYRDLKPENIGFDTNGVLKLFDFGLAKELKGIPDTDTGKYNLTGQTGSRRYMAPEVANGAPYDLSVDVYSFGILLWELATMEKPFQGYSSYKHQSQVIERGERPPIHHNDSCCCPIIFQSLLRSCWSDHAPTRPKFEKIRETLQEIVNQLQEQHHHQCEEKTSSPAGRIRSVGLTSPKSSPTSNRRIRSVGLLSTKSNPSLPKKSLPLPIGGFKSIPRPSTTTTRKGRGNNNNVRSKSHGDAVHISKMDHDHHHDDTTFRSQRSHENRRSKSDEHIRHHQKKNPIRHRLSSIIGGYMQHQQK